MNKSVAHALSNVAFGPEVVVGNLTMVSLKHRALKHPAPAPAPVHPAPQPTHYVLLDDALASGVTEITEVSEQGSVPELLVVNRGPDPVLIIDGEELVGAKQNRVVNLTILVPAQSKLTIPVSCVEAGRWSARSRGFSSVPRAQYATGRARRMKYVSVNMSVSGAAMSDQSDVWADIAEKSHRLGSHSPTSAMEAMYVDHAASIDSYVQGCQPTERQVGALFAIDHIVIGFDLFDREETLRKLLPKLIRSVAVDAIDRERVNGRLDTSSALPLAERFLAAVSAVPHRVAKSIGVGDDVRLAGSGMTGAALVAEGEVIHVAAFTV
jgi:hypothetical protein